MKMTEVSIEIRVKQFVLISELKRMIVLVQTSVVYLISCTYLQIAGTNQSRRGNDVNLNATYCLMKVHGGC